MNMSENVKHKHYTTASLNERLLFKKFSDNNPGLFTNITYSDPEGFDSWDVMYTLSGETKQRLAELKVRPKPSTYDDYYIQQDKYQSLMASAFTYTIEYINFFNDNSILLWNLNETPPPVFNYRMCQDNDIDNQPKLKMVADLYTTASTRQNSSYTITQAKKKAEKVYKERLQPEHPKKWKRI